VQGWTALPTKYEANAGRNIRQLHQRLKDGTYQAQPLRRIYPENPERGREAEAYLDSDGDFIMHFLQSLSGYLGYLA